MKRALSLALSAIFSIAIVTGIVHAESIVGRVVGVTDGDTITMLDNFNQQHRVRLAGIDAPEKDQPHGQSAKRSLSDLVYEKQVSVETIKRDRYGREIGKVLSAGQDVNLEQIRQGMAWHYRRYENEQSLEDRLAYRAAEEEARAARRGLWADPDVMAPWDWRKR